MANLGGAAVGHSHTSVQVDDFDTRTKALAEEWYSASMDAKFVKMNSMLGSDAKITAFLSDMETFATYSETIRNHIGLSQSMFVGKKAVFGKTECVVVDVDRYGLTYMANTFSDSGYSVISDVSTTDYFGVWSSTTSTEGTTVNQRLRAFYQKMPSEIKARLVSMAQKAQKPGWDVTGHRSCVLFIPANSELGAPSQSTFSSPEADCFTLFSSVNDKEKTMAKVFKAIGFVDSMASTTVNFFVRDFNKRNRIAQTSCAIGASAGSIESHVLPCFKVG